MTLVCVIGPYDPSAFIPRKVCRIFTSSPFVPNLRVLLIGVRENVLIEVVEVFKVEGGVIIEVFAPPGGEIYRLPINSYTVHSE